MLCRRYAQLGALVTHKDREVTGACVTGISDNLSGLNRGTFARTLSERGAGTDFNSTDMLTRLSMAAAPAMDNSIKNKNITSMGTIFPKITRILLLKNETVGYRKKLILNSLEPPL